MKTEAPLVIMMPSPGGKAEQGSLAHSLTAACRCPVSRPLANSSYSHRNHGEFNEFYLFQDTPLEAWGGAESFVAMSLKDSPIDAFLFDWTRTTSGVFVQSPTSKGTARVTRDAIHFAFPNVIALAYETATKAAPGFGLG
jgi:hypothetical protein